MGRKASTLCPLHQTDLELEFRRSVLLAAQVALLGEVSGAIRGITLGWTSSEVMLRALVDGPVDEEDEEAMECVGTEIIAGFPTHEVSVEVLRVDAPADIKCHGLKAWVFMRKEEHR
jgi:hypothetical protein